MAPAGCKTLHRHAATVAVLTSRPGGTSKVHGTERPFRPGGVEACAAPKKPLSPAAERALAEAAERRAAEQQK
jgi:hypothetical protein